VGEELDYCDGVTTRDLPRQSTFASFSGQTRCNVLVYEGRLRATTRSCRSSDRFCRQSLKITILQAMVRLWSRRSRFQWGHHCPDMTDSTEIFLKWAIQEIISANSIPDRHRFRRRRNDQQKAYCCRQPNGVVHCVSTTTQILQRRNARPLSAGGYRWAAIPVTTLSPRFGRQRDHSSVVVSALSCQNVQRFV
jgi:hypothetical protein